MAYNPKRIVTETRVDKNTISVVESDHTQYGCRSTFSTLETKWKNANIVCIYESYQRVDTSVFIVTKNTRPEHVYKVKSCTKNKVIFVEKGAGIPNLPYKASSKFNLINVQ